MKNTHILLSLIITRNWRKPYKLALRFLKHPDK